MNSTPKSQDMLKNEIARLCHLYNNCHVLTPAQIQEELIECNGGVDTMIKYKQEETIFALQYPQIQHIQPQVALGYLSLNPTNQLTCIKLRPPTSVELMSSTERIANLRPIYDKHQTLSLQMAKVMIQYRCACTPGSQTLKTQLELELEIDALKTDLNINEQIQLKLQKEDAFASQKEEEEQLFQASIVAINDPCN